eukprot:EST47802.1 Hypothetical protein SS50377_12203 [Spironucleus salmonicida]
MQSAQFVAYQARPQNQVQCNCNVFYLCDTSGACVLRRDLALGLAAGGAVLVLGVGACCVVFCLNRRHRAPKQPEHVPQERVLQAQSGIVRLGRSLPAAPRAGHAPSLTGSASVEVFGQSLPRGKVFII